MTGPASPPDPYCYPGTRVLMNRFNIRDPFELAQAADDISSASMYRLGHEPVAGEFDLAHLQRIHEAIWGDLYPWAGEIRTIGLAKEGVAFCASRDIPEAAEYTFASLAAHNHLRGLSTDQFVDALTGYHGAIDYLHPFRDGNGHAARVFLGQLAHDAGYHIAWERSDPVVNDYASYQQRTLVTPGPMRTVFDELVDERTAQADRDPNLEADRLHDLATRVRADAAAHHAAAQELKARAAQGTGEHVTRLLEQRDRLDRQVRAIHELDDAALGHTHPTAEETHKLTQVAGPDPGRTATLTEHQVLTERWDSLHASSQALDELAAHHPADLARRQDARADRITDRAATLEHATPQHTTGATATESAAERLRDARRSYHHSPEATQTADGTQPRPNPAHRSENLPRMPTRIEVLLSGEISPELLDPPPLDAGPEAGL